MRMIPVRSLSRPYKADLHQDGDYDLKIMPGRYRLRITGAYRTQPYHQVFKPEYFAEGEIAITREVPHPRGWIGSLSN